VCGDSEHPRNDPITDLDHPFHLERRAHESHEVVGEGVIRLRKLYALVKADLNDARTLLLTWEHQAGPVPLVTVAR
jgi:hypothetical protein